MPPKKKKREDLSPRQRRILEYIHDACQLRQYPPTIREIGDAAGLQSTSSVSHQLNELERKGYLRRDPNKPRAIILDALPDGLSPQRPTSKGTQSSDTGTDQNAINVSPTATVPLVGSIAAGTPITAEQNLDEYFPLPTSFVGNSDELFMLEVKGESMIEMGILDGDFIVVKAQKRPESGEIVAAQIEGEATVKEFRVDDDGIWLVPHNSAMEPIPADNAEIVGKVVSLLRRF